MQSSHLHPSVCNAPPIDDTLCSANQFKLTGAEAHLSALGARQAVLSIMIIHNFQTTSH